VSGVNYHNHPLVFPPGWISYNRASFIFHFIAISAPLDLSWGFIHSWKKVDVYHWCADPVTSSPDFLIPGF